mmetsp:Transcript_25640/g.41677  ORF Transcript_25640/g.41677 Transcript_25640/m.41677 type:complete len:247 (-) Transcript_25640:34-774(-)
MELGLAHHVPRLNRRPLGLVIAYVPKRITGTPSRTHAEILKAVYRSHARAHQQALRIERLPTGIVRIETSVIDHNVHLPLELVQPLRRRQRQALHPHRLHVIILPTLHRRHVHVRPLQLGQLHRRLSHGRKTIRHEHVRVGQRRPVLLPHPQRLVRGHVHVGEAHGVGGVDVRADDGGDVLGGEFGVVAVAAALAGDADDAVADAVALVAGGLADVGDAADYLAAGDEWEGYPVDADVAAEETISE